MIVVTGGAGFIGSALIWELNRRNREDILVVDALGQDEKWKNLVGLRFADYMEKADFLEAVESRKFDTKMEAIIHLGACSSTTERDVSFLAQNNYGYSQSLARYAFEKGIRFIYASSAATYGDGSKGYSDDHAALDQLEPLNAYGFSKHLFDLWLYRQGALDKAVGLKYFNVFGPNEWHKDDMRSMVCKGFEQIRETGKVKLFASDRPEFGDGEQQRDFLYVKDAVDMTLFFLDHPQPTGIFNIGTGRAENWNALMTAIFKALDKEPAIEYIPMPEHLRGKYQYHTQADMAKMRKAGYGSECRSLEEAVADYVQNYLAPAKTLGTAG